VSSKRVDALRAQAADAEHATAGYVYGLTNPAMPDQLKIGFTTRSPWDRARELSGPSGVPQPYVLEWALRYDDAKAAEQSIHRRLQHARTSSSREFFRCSPEEGLWIAMHMRQREHG